MRILSQLSRGAGAAAVVGTVLAGAVATAGAASQPTTSTTVPQCGLHSLAAWSGPSTGAAGSRVAEYGFTNRSTRTCTLRGFPGVQMLNASGAAVPTAEQHAPGAFGLQVTTVRLAPGRTAYFGVEYASQTGYARASCPKAAALRLTPPQVTGTLTLRGPAARIAPYGGTTTHLKCGIVHVSALSAKRFQ